MTQYNTRCIKLDDFNKVKQLPVLISKIQHDELVSKVVIPLMQVIGQAGGAFQPN